MAKAETPEETPEETPLPETPDKIAPEQLAFEGLDEVDAATRRPGTHLHYVYPAE